MPRRRDVLGLLGLGIAGTVGYLEWQPNIADPVSGPPARDTELKTVEPRGLLTKFVFYESGATDIHFAQDHGCYTELEIYHSDGQTRYAAYDAPEFAGPITIDLKGVIQQQGPYPNNRFKFELTSGSSSICLTPGDTAYVDVPTAYLP